MRYSLLHLCPRMTGSQPWIGRTAGSMLTSLISGIMTSLLDESRSAGSETPDHGFVEPAGSIYSSYYCALATSGIHTGLHRIRPAAPTPKLGPRGPIALK